MPHDLGFTHIALPVRSLERSLAFYARYADLAVVHRRGGVAWISDRTRPFAIVLMECDDATTPITPLAPEAHIGVALASKDAVDARFAQARTEGIVVREPEQYPAPVGYWGYLRDPDGHTLELSFGQEVELAVRGPVAVASRPMQKLQGRCHCGAVHFEIESDFPELTQCDCSICRRKNALMVKVHESQFKLLAGDEALTEYRFHTGTARHFFCKVCGIYPFHRKRVTPDYLGINVFCLEGFDPAGIPVRQAVGAAMG